MEGNGTQQCIPALENTNSTGADYSGMPITLETLTILPGYWRSVATSTTILPCWNEDACLGGVTDNANFCASGYTGPCELGNCRCLQCRPRREYMLRRCFCCRTELAIVAILLFRRTRAFRFCQLGISCGPDIVVALFNATLLLPANVCRSPQTVPSVRTSTQ